MTECYHPWERVPVITVVIAESTGTMSKSKSKRRAVVRGPQLALRPANGNTAVKERTRVLFAEPPAKVKGSPFVAVRVPSELLAAYKSLAKKRGFSVNEMIRKHMSKVTGVSLVADEGEE